MLKEVKEEWLKALRGGKYLQARGQLMEDLSDDQANSVQAFCCLGVLADLRWPDEWFGTDLHFEDAHEGSDTCSGELPNCYLNDVGMTYEEQQDLIRLNDGHKWEEKYNLVNQNPDGHELGEIVNGIRYVKGKEPQSFIVIADYIEENL